MNPKFSTGNQLTLLENGAEYFPALIAAIEAAHDEVYLETYIFAADVAGRNVTAALIRAAERGVAVRILVDGFGASDFAAELGTELARKGVQTMTYRPELAPLRLQKNRLRRLHRKLAVMDGRVGFVGGINVLDDFNDGEGETIEYPRHDYAVRVEGPLVARIHHEMRSVWQLVRWSRLARRPPSPPPLAAVPAAVGAMKAALLVRDNLRHRRDIETAYLEAIHSAQDEILIANAYFLPGTRIRHALQAAARRGVRVTLLLQGRIEHALQYFATQALYIDLLKSGIRIYAYRRSFLHAKVAVIDADWSTVGSSNIDPFSLLLAREANVLVQDQDFADQLRASLRRAMTAEDEVTLATLRRRSWPLRLLDGLAYGLVKLLLELTGVGRHYAD